MSIEVDKPKVDPETLRKEWQNKYDPNLEDLQGMRAYIEKRMGGDQGDTLQEPEPVSKFNNFQ